MNKIVFPNKAMDDRTAACRLRLDLLSNSTIPTRRTVLGCPGRLTGCAYPKWVQ